MATWPELIGARLLREIRELGYRGDKTMLNDFLRKVRPSPSPRASRFASRCPPGARHRSTSQSSKSISPVNRSHARSGYLVALFRNLPLANTVDDYEKLLPWNIEIGAA